MRTRHLIWCAVAGSLAAAVAVTAMTATEVIQQRQQAMSEVRNGMLVLGAIAKNQQPFDAEVVQASAGQIAENLELAAKLFPDGTDQGEVETWAKAEIWSEREQFDQLLADSHEAAVALQSVSEADAFLPALGKLGNSCKSCHDPYRLPKN